MKKRKLIDWLLFGLLVLTAFNKSITPGEHLIATVIVIAIWELRHD